MDRYIFFIWLFFYRIGQQATFQHCVFVLGCRYIFSILAVLFRPNVVPSSSLACCSYPCLVLDWKLLPWKQTWKNCGLKASLVIMLYSRDNVTLFSYNPWWAANWCVVVFFLLFSDEAFVTQCQPSWHVEQIKFWSNKSTGNKEKDWIFMTCMYVSWYFKND